MICTCKILSVHVYVFVVLVHTSLCLVVRICVYELGWHIRVLVHAGVVTVISSIKGTSYLARACPCRLWRGSQWVGWLFPRVVMWDLCSNGCTTSVNLLF